MVLESCLILSKQLLKTNVLTLMKKITQIGSTKDKEKETMRKESNFTIRLSKAAKELNVGKDTIVEFLAKKGFQVNPAPNTKLSADMYELLSKEFQAEKSVKDLSKRLGELSYRGGSVSVKSATEDNNERNIKKKKSTTLSNTEPTNEENNGEKEILVSLEKLHFGTNTISLKYDSIEFVLWETHISHYLNSEKSILKLSTKVLLDYSNKTFQFLDLSLLSNLKDLSVRLTKDEEIKQKREEKRKQKKLQKL